MMLGRLARRLRALLFGGTLDDELDEELRYHLEREIEQNVRAGMRPKEARYAALKSFGGLERAREECREARGVRFIGDLWQDLRYGTRVLRKKPGFTLVAVVTLALGLGASTAIFSAVNPILFEPLPYPQASRVMMIWDRQDEGSRLELTFGTYRELVERTRSFDALAVMVPWQPTTTAGGRPERLEGQRVSASYFRALGVRPTLGRDFRDDEDVSNGPNVVILSDGLWRRRFGGDGAIIGRQITLYERSSYLTPGDSYTVIGVMPREFENVLDPSAELWAPLQYDKALPPMGKEWGHHLRMVGRLRQGFDADQAAHELNVIAHAPLAEFPRVEWASLGQGFVVASLKDEVARGVRPALLALIGAVLLVLLMACVNVTNLLLARGAQRRGEFSMRAALGAGRWRLTRQLLTESLLLAALGGALGMFVAEAGVRALVALSPPGLPRVGAIRLDGAVFAFGVCVTTLIGLAVGLIPALHASCNDLHTGIQESSQRTSGGHQLMRRTLVVAEVALALVLLVSAGLLLHSLRRLFSVDPGFNPSHLLTMQVQEVGQRFAKDADRYRFYTQALDAVRRVPGVTAAAFTSQLPLSGDLEKYGVQFESSPNGRPEEDHSAFRYAVTPGYFELMGIALRRGRLLDEHDAAGQPVAVLINESFARRKFPGQDPIGQHVRIGPDAGRADRPWATIVGVVGDVKQMSLSAGDEDDVYTTTAQWLWVDTEQALVVRTAGDPAALAPAIREAVWSADRDQPIARVATMNSLLAESEAARRFVLTLFEAFGIAALVLAATGIYGVLSGSVAERTREIGVRLALGATRGNILALIVRQGMTLTCVGVLIGLLGALAASRGLVSLLFGVSALDAVVYFGVVALLAFVSALACSVPAWRAARVDPSVTLRAE
jgi:putative ABC transport system permease protein